MMEYGGVTEQEMENFTYIIENCIPDPICYGKTQVQLLSLRQEYTTSDKLLHGLLHTL